MFQEHDHFHCVNIWRADCYIYVAGFCCRRQDPAVYNASIQ